MMFLSRQQPVPAARLNLQTYIDHSAAPSTSCMLHATMQTGDTCIKTTRLQFATFSNYRKSIWPRGARRQGTVLMPLHVLDCRVGRTRAQRPMCRALWACESLYSALSASGAGDQLCLSKVQVAVSSEQLFMRVALTPATALRSRMQTGQCRAWRWRRAHLQEL